MLNGDNADVSEDIVVDWSLRFPRSPTAKVSLPVHPESHFQCRRYCYALPYVYVCYGVHMIYESNHSRTTIPLIRPHQWGPEGGRIRVVLL